MAIRDISWRKTIAVLKQKTRQLESENLTLKATWKDRDHLGELWGRSAAMQTVYVRIMQAAACDETVMLYGETGTGKELAARTIFQLSEHHTHPGDGAMLLTAPMRTIHHIRQSVQREQYNLQQAVEHFERKYIRSRHDLKLPGQFHINVLTCA